MNTAPDPYRSRALSPVERGELERRTRSRKPERSRFRDAILAPAFFALVFLPIVLFGLGLARKAGILSVQRRSILLVSYLLLYCVFQFLWQRELAQRRRAFSKRRDAMLTALTNNNVEAADFQAKRAFTFGTEDELGFRWVMHLADDTALVLEEPENGATSEAWPNTHFEVSRIPGTREVFMVHKRGSALPIVRLDETIDHTSRELGVPFPLEWGAFENGGVTV